jgi:hypothetical protein
MDDEQAERLIRVARRTREAVSQRAGTKVFGTSLALATEQMRSLTQQVTDLRAELKHLREKD